MREDCPKSKDGTCGWALIEGMIDDGGKSGIRTHVCEYEDAPTCPIFRPKMANITQEELDRLRGG